MAIIFDSRKIRILPVMVLVASICLMVRVGDLVVGVRQVGIAFAQEEVDAEPPAMPKAHGDDMEVVAEDEAMPEEEKEYEAIEWKDATEAEYDYSEVKVGLYKDLAARRKGLENRERSMNVREALLEAAERELNQKLREMVAVRNEIEGLLQTQSDEEMARIGSLVKIYEGMKAKDAARIFNTLDMDVLLAMISRMSERKSSPILAEMNADRARAVTILLAQQKQIPSIPPQ